MKTKAVSLNRQDRKIIRKQFKSAIFNVSVFFVFGFILIIVFPYFEVEPIRNLSSNSTLIIQFALLLILVSGLILYFLFQTRIFRSELRNNIKAGDTQKLLRKVKKPRRNYIIYSPGKIEDNNNYLAKFEQSEILINKDIWDKLTEGEEYDLYFTPESNVFLNISDKNYSYYR